MTSSSGRACHVSPHCVPSQLLGEALGFHGGGPAWSWLHLGPIEPGLVPIVEHRGRGVVTRRVVPGGSLARFAGLRLDVLGSPSPTPGVDANYHGLTGTWYVYAVAWRQPDGPSVSWRVDSSGTDGLTWSIPGSHPSAADRHLVARLQDLVVGRMARPGRRPRVEADPERIRRIVASADEMKAANPRLSMEIIASNLGVSDRALRNYQHDVHHGLLSGDPHLDAEEVRRIS